MAGDRPRSRSLTQTPNTLAGIGLEPGSRLERELVARGGNVVESLDAVALHLVIGHGARDAAALVARALESGSRVLVEEPLALLASGMTADRERIAVAFAHRFEPAATAARASLEAGTVGLPFAVTAEAVAPAAGGSATLALDLLDAALFVTGLELESAVRMGADPFVASLLLGHGTVGDVSAMASARGSIAGLNVRGSHGSLAVNLAAAHVTIQSDQLEMRRMGTTGTARMLQAFVSGQPLPTLEGASVLAAKVGAVG